MCELTSSCRADRSAGLCARVIATVVHLPQQGSAKEGDVITESEVNQNNILKEFKFFRSSQGGEYNWPKQAGIWLHVLD